MAHKEGLQAALEFTKYALAIAGAAIAFLLGSDILKDLDDGGRRLLTLSLLGFGFSALGGILVLMEGATQLSNGQYSLENKFLLIPGLVNVLGLAAGFVFATWFMLATIWSHEAAKPQNIKVQGTLNLNSAPAAKTTSK